MNSVLPEMKAEILSEQCPRIGFARIHFAMLGLKIKESALHVLIWLWAAMICHHPSKFESFFKLNAA